MSRTLKSEAVAEVFNLNVAVEEAQATNGAVIIPFIFTQDASNASVAQQFVSKTLTGNSLISTLINATALNVQPSIGGTNYLSLYGFLYDASQSYPTFAQNGYIRSFSIQLDGSGNPIGATIQGAFAGQALSYNMSIATNGLAFSSPSYYEETAITSSTSPTTVEITGAGPTFNDTGESVVLQNAGSSLTATGTGTVELQASSQTLTLNTAGAVVTIDAGLTGDTVNANADTINAGSGFNGQIGGTGNTVNFTANGGDWAGIWGSDTINNDTGTDSVTLAVSNASVTLNGAGTTIGTAAGITGDTIITANGSGTINLASGFNGQIGGTGNTVNFTANGGDWAGIWGSDTINNDTGTDSATLAVSNATITLNGAGATLSTGVSSTNVDVTADVINGSSDTINVPGTGAPISLLTTAPSGALTAGIDIIGNGNTIGNAGNAVTLAANEVAAINGTGSVTLAGSESDS